ncbi:GNAT family N-acetyltransferase [Halomicroarcula limicola]|uniref:GNAT family N-acetyltransferase n=1 Tax=Haloarcula limicola TaxID=1429915 RepID=A0A8J8C686_9EURY|nr:GNAT family N-acetyltransferase [Halomicroarcula limicola]MBV0925949.1 GNAT family N-acetyltransferase [Halomicroarcula limicola]
MNGDVDEQGAACTGWNNSSCEGTEYCPPRCPRFVDRAGVPRIARRYEPTDFDAVVDMYDDLDSYSRTQGIPPATRSGIESWVSSLVENGLNLVVEGNGRILGHAAAVPLSASAPELVIFLHQSVRNNGIGSELLKHLIAHADDENHDGLTLNVSCGNSRAITVYENIGFDETERTKTDIAMELSMDEPIVDRVQLFPAQRES